MDSSLNLNKRICELLELGRFKVDIRDPESKFELEIINRNLLDYSERSIYCNELDDYFINIKNYSSSEFVNFLRSNVNSLDWDLKFKSSVYSDSSLSSYYISMFVRCKYLLNLISLRKFLSEEILEDYILELISSYKCLQVLNEYISRDLEGLRLGVLVVKGDPIKLYCNCFKSGLYGCIRGTTSCFCSYKNFLFIDGAILDFKGWEAKCLPSSSNIFIEGKSHYLKDFNNYSLDQKVKIEGLLSIYNFSICIIQGDFIDKVIFFDGSGYLYILNNNLLLEFSRGVRWGLMRDFIDILRDINNILLTDYSTKLLLEKSKNKKKSYSIEDGVESENEGGVTPYLSYLTSLEVLSFNKLIFNRMVVNKLLYDISIDFHTITFSNIESSETSLSIREGMARSDSVMVSIDDSSKSLTGVPIVNVKSGVSWVDSFKDKGIEEFSLSKLGEIGLGTYSNLFSFKDK